MYLFSLSNGEVFVPSLVVMNLTGGLGWSIQVFAVCIQTRRNRTLGNLTMAIPTKTIWPLDPHTLAKHEILRRYLQCWFPILNTYHGRIIYVDGFCGPGRYSKGESGSPIIALEVATTHRKALGGELVFWFIDERQTALNI